MVSLTEEDEIKCPFCKNAYNNLHIVRTWVCGKTITVLNGDKHIEDLYTSFIFNGIWLGNSSSIIIMYENEHCSHVWLEITLFHEGSVFRYVSEVSAGDLLKYLNATKDLGNEMWRT